MAVQVQGPRRQKRDLFDVVMGGLQAAQAFTNIQKARQEMEAIPELRKRAQEQQAFQATQKQEQEARRFAKEWVPAPKEAKEGVKGAVLLTTPTGQKGLFVPRQKQMTPKERNDVFKGVQNRFKEDKQFQKAFTKVTDAGQLIELSKQAKLGNQAAFEQMKVIIARMNQGGVLTDQDIATLGGSQALLDIVNRWKTMKIVGEVRPKDIDDLLDVGKTAYTSGIATANDRRKDILTTEFERLQIAGFEDVTKEQLDRITKFNVLMKEGAIEFPERTTPRGGLKSPKTTKQPALTPEEDLKNDMDLFDKAMEKVKETTARALGK